MNFIASISLIHVFKLIKFEYKEVVGDFKFWFEYVMNALLLGKLISIIFFEKKIKSKYEFFWEKNYFSWF